jgi:hypothetical protein
LGLGIQRLNEVRMGMAKSVDCHAGGEIEVALAIGREQPWAFAPLEGKIDACIGRQ